MAYPSNGIPLSVALAAAKGQVSEMTTLGKWQVSAWYSTDLDSADRRHFDDIGVNIRRTRGNLTVHMGPNKLSRHRGYQAGIEVDGSRQAQYAIARLWVVYWTLTFGLSWDESERARRWKKAHSEQ